MIKMNNSNVQMSSEELKKIPLFNGLSEEDLLHLAGSSTVFEVGKADKIYDQGQSIEFIYFVLQGCVKVGAVAGPEKVIIKSLIYENEVFGENVFTSTKRSEFAEALKSCTILRIPAAKVQDLIYSSGFFANAVTSVIIGRIKKLDERMEAFVFKTAKSRIVDFLKFSALQKGTKIGFDEMLLNHGMSHKEIAYLTDTSRQTVARVLTELKNLNIIHFSSRMSHKILIRNLAAL